MSIEMEFVVPPFLTSAVDGGEWSASHPRERVTGTQWLIESQSQSGFCGIERNLLSQLGIKPRPSIP
jgi:hypothetical protein